MIFGNDREQLRKAYNEAWGRFQQGHSLQPLEQQLVDVLKEHPEYHQQIQNTSTDYLPEAGQTNPFLHMGMHLAIREQVSTNRPTGISTYFQLLSQRHQSAHEAEHQMMECLAEALWQSQQNNTMPDEYAYLDCIKKLTQK